MSWYPNTKSIQDNGFGGSRNGSPINGVVIHHVAGTNGLAYVANKNARNSHPTYHIANDGSVTGIVNPDRRPYSTGGQPDPSAVTFEIDNSSTGGDWPVSEAAVEALIDVIIFHGSRSPRAGKGFAKNIKDQTQVEFFVAWHSQYKATACPGPSLNSRLDYIVAECNKRASNSTSITKPKPPVQSKPLVRKLVKLGSTGESVKYVQKVLGVKVDGQFGPITDRAVKNFQSANGLVNDGIVGPITYAALERQSPAQDLLAKPEGKPKLTKLLRLGSSGDHVVYLQRALNANLKLDGVFGPITERRVREFQRAQGLQVDGIVGPITWGKLS
jgi:peptidoglycan hydrolase-like protein with peptidoglycan-binding domain